MELEKQSDAFDMLEQSASILSLLDHLICMIAPGQLSFENSSREGLCHLIKLLESNITTSTKFLRHHSIKLCKKNDQR